VRCCARTESPLNPKRMSVHAQHSNNIDSTTDDVFVNMCVGNQSHVRWLIIKSGQHLTKSYFPTNVTRYNNDISSCAKQ
jgi:hypothetical protein